MILQILMSAVATICVVKIVKIRKVRTHVHVTMDLSCCLIKDPAKVAYAIVTAACCIALHIADIDECQTDNGGCAQNCVNTDGSYKCSCYNGFEMTSDGYTCVGEYPSSCLLLYRCYVPDTQYNIMITKSIITQSRNVYAQHILHTIIVATINSFIYALLYMIYNAIYVSILTDVNECKRSNGGCDHICTNTNGSHQCSCRDGYSLAEDNSHCVGMQYNKLIHTLTTIHGLDNDECQSNNGGCSQSCINTAGSYHCQCWDGYKMNNDSNCTGKSLNS